MCPIHSHKANRNYIMYANNNNKDKVGLISLPPPILEMEICDHIILLCMKCARHFFVCAHQETIFNGGCRNDSTFVHMCTSACFAIREYHTSLIVFTQIVCASFVHTSVIQDKRLSLGGGCGNGLPPNYTFSTFFHTICPCCLRKRLHDSANR